MSEDMTLIKHYIGLKEIWMKYLKIRATTVTNVVATGVVNLPMSPLCNTFRIIVDSHYSLAGQALCIMRPWWPYFLRLGFAISYFSLPPFRFEFPKQITDNCFRFYQYIIYLSKCPFEIFLSNKYSSRNHNFT